MRRYLRTIVFFFLILVTPRLYSLGQNASNFIAAFKVLELPAEKYITLLDSLILRNEMTGERKIFIKPQSADNVFKIGDLAIGKYRIWPYKEGMSIFYADFSICTLCKNSTDLIAYPKKGITIFDNVWISPHYKYGFKQQCSDFLSVLTEDEKQTLKEVGNNLIINCFVTTKGELSDIEFMPADLPEKNKKIIQKGLEKLSWVPGIVNGKFSDDYMTIPVYKMLD